MGFAFYTMRRAAACPSLQFHHLIDWYQDAEKPRQQKKIVIWFIWFVSFVWLNQTDQMNKTNQFQHPEGLGESVWQAGHMHLELAPRHIVDIAAQGILHHGKCDLVPGNCRE